MAAAIATTKLGGFTSATSSVTPTGGTALGSLLSVTVMDDGTLTFNDAAGNVRVLQASPELHALLSQLTVGTNGVSTTKVWNKD